MVINTAKTKLEKKEYKVPQEGYNNQTQVYI